MTAVRLKRFTSYDFGVGIGYLPVHVNPCQIAYVQPRRRLLGDNHVVDGTLLYFQQEGGVLAVREDVDEVLAVLAGHDYERDLTYEAARADPLP